MIDPLLNELRRRRVRIWAQDGQLRYHASHGTLAPDLVARLRTHRVEILERLASVVAVSPGPAAERSANDDVALSLAQQRMWLAWKLAPDSPAYNIAFIVTVRGALERDRLLHAVGAVRLRHDVLRTRFVETAGGVRPVLDESERFDVPLVHVRDAAAMHRELRLRAVMPFDLTRAAPFEARLYMLGDDEHRLFVRLHHIVADARSVAIFLSELAALYEAPDRAPCELPMQYVDFARQEREMLRGPAPARSLSYWRQRLDGVPGELPLPLDRPRPGARSGAGRRAAFELPVRVTARLAEIGRSRQATRFTVLASAFRILLARYSGQWDFVIATPTISRNEQATERLIGYFGNTLLLRSPIAATQSYVDVLDRERSTVLEALDHQALQLEALADELALPRVQRAGPPFQALFTFADADPAAAWPSGLQIEAAEVETETAKCDLLLAMQAGDAGLGGVFEYDADLFDHSTIERMARHLEALLTDFAWHPRRAVGDTLLATPPERRRLLRGLNDTRRPLGHEHCLHELFERQVEDHPDAVAVYHMDRRVTYGELNDEANRIAYGVLRSGSRRDRLVGVCARRSPQLVAALLGVLKAGAAYVPIDPRYPIARMRSIADDFAAELVITERALVDPLRQHGRSILLLDEASEPAGNPDRVSRLEDLAYVLYTSGSSGAPKGVMIEHRSAARLLGWAYGTYGPAELAGVLAATSVCFDLSVFELFVPLCAGHSVVLADDALRLSSLPGAREITLINTVPSIMRILLESQGGAFPEALRTVNLAGEALDTRLVADVYRRTPATKVYDLYGPTEATTYATFKLRAADGPASIGRPLANGRCYVLDPRGVPVPIGVDGELYLAGGGLARGYLGRPQLTAERFAPPASRHVREERMYRTGDVARYTASGELQYRGRVDDQLKVRGFRIEPAEVRAALVTGAGVRDAAVVGRVGVSGETDLAAYVVPDGPGVEVAGLRNHVRALLPEYMVPTSFTLVKAIPQTPNGKVDQARLRAAGGNGGAAPCAPPLTASERTILTIWREVLRAERVGVRDDFFEVGGHSLAAMRVTGRVNAALAVDLDLDALFRHPTVAALAAHVDAMRASDGQATLPAIRAHAAGSSPATLLQRHLWIVHRLVEDASFLNVHRTVTLDGPLDTDAIERALRDLLRRQPILGARFVGEAGRLVQHIAPDVTLDVVTADLTGLDGDHAKERGLASIAGKVWRRPFDLPQGPCARFAIARLSPDRHVVVMVVHHIVTDEWSMGILGAELARFASPDAGGGHAPAAPLTFADYAWWEDECLRDGLFDGQLARWKAVLAPPLPRLSLRWRPSPGRAPEEVQSYPVTIDARLSEQLASLARRERTSLFVVLLSALKRLLALESGGSDILVATNLALRHRREVQDIVGPLTDTLIVRTHLPHGHGSLTALRRVRDAFASACGHRDIPFEEMARRLEAETGVERRQFAQTFFLLDEGGPAASATASQADEQGDFFKAALHDYDLMLYLERGGDRIEGQLTLKGRLGDGSVARELLCGHRALLHDLVGSLAQEP